MIKLIGDYHTHTIYSSGFRKEGKHAIGTIRDNAEAALAKGLSEIAITEHGPGHYLYGVRKKRIPLMKSEIDRLNEEFIPKGLKILLGIESNLVGLDGTLDVDEKLLKYIDFLIMGYHYGATPKTLKDGIGLYVLNPISKIFHIGKEKAKELNTRAYIKALGKYPINMISHPGSKAVVDIVELAREANKYGTALEISAKHSQLSVESIKLLLDMDVIYMVNSDAHRPEDVGNVENGIRKAKEANLPLDRIKNIEIN
ncbi:PHP domain-containing protein [Tissierella carlieri]|jgi:putative hydrolase|uniref:PHP domain-containing protein n=1 Tax=Tissierella carlieri TaxID=689904 RepID=A0ABT1S8A8_9FIRM|nr:PHP domain-containing protein [Tissierella carlieri]MCQ4922699.1 PHP domain-containing protein [Tissierella carlieri]MDU5082768.1 PHP domain-containing protein [Bacillota bacterium]